MHNALGLVILLKDEQGAPMSTQKALSIVDVDFFKQLTGFTFENGWELKEATPPLWGGKPVERHMTIISPQEIISLTKFYADTYPHVPSGGFTYTNLSDTIEDGEIREQYEEGRFLALDGTFQPFLNGDNRSVPRGKQGEPVFKMALRYAMNCALHTVGNPKGIQFVANDTLVLELASCTFLESLATKALAIGIDDDAKSFCRDFRGGMCLVPEFPTSKYSVQVKPGTAAVWTELEGEKDTFMPHATFANAGPTTRTLSNVDVQDVKRSLRVLAEAAVQQRLPNSSNQAFVSFGPATSYMKEQIMQGSSKHPAVSHGVNLDELNYTFPPPYFSIAGNFDQFIKQEWQVYQDQATAGSNAWVNQCAAMLQYELVELMPFFINVTSEDGKKLLPNTCRYDPRSPIEKLRHHSQLSQEVAMMIASSVVGEDFCKACDFWKINTKDACIETEMQNLKKTAPAVAAFVEQDMERRKLRE